MGCEVEASDLNPVAVLILKGTVEYPQKYGQPNGQEIPAYIREAPSGALQSGFAEVDMFEAYHRNPLATDVRYWCHWMLEKAREELAEFYTPDPDGSIPVAYLWSRTIPCPNCNVEMPLIRQYWLARQDRKRVALEPVIEREGLRVDFRVVEGADVSGDPSEATTSGGDTRCLFCRQVVKGADVRRFSTEGKMAATLTSVVLAAENSGGKRFRSRLPNDIVAYEAAIERLNVLDTQHQGDLALVPDEPIDPKTLGLRVDAFGFDQWGKLFNSRQLLTLTTFARLVGEANAYMLKTGLDKEYAKAVSTYLGLAVSRLTGENCTLTIDGLLSAGLVPDASWPIDTEMGTKVSASNQARLKTSVWMSCRKREEKAGQAFLGNVLEEMRPVVRERLLYFWSKGIRGADFFISAIGPALSVFGRYERVLRPGGGQVSVRDFLDIVRRESTDVALQQVLHGADLGVIDPVTRQYTTWVWSYSRAPLDAGEAIALCLATGASYADTIRTGSIAAEGREKSKTMVRLRTVRQRAMEDEDLGFGTAARPSPLIDQLQYAAWLWGQNRADDLGGYRGSLGETRWSALRTLGQAVAGCLPDGDEDRRIILGLLGSSVMAMAPPDNGRPRRRQRAGARLPGFETEDDDGTA